MATNWFFQVMGDVKGPVTAAQLKRLAEIGNISVDTLVRKGEVGSWVSADQVQGLFEPVSPTAPESPPAASPLPPPPPPPLADRLPSSNGDHHPPFVATVGKGRRSSHTRPKSLRQWLVYFFDPMFERFLTPWIIRVTWVLLLIVSMLVTIVVGYGHASFLGGLEPDLSEVQLAERRLALAKAVLEELEQMRGMNRQPSRDFERPRYATTPDEPNHEAEPTRRVDPLEQAQLDVREAEADLAKAREALPSRLELTAEHLPMQAVRYILEIAACTLIVLWLRVILEGGIVLFSIVTKLGSIDDRLAALNRTGVPPSS